MTSHRTPYRHGEAAFTDQSVLKEMGFRRNSLVRLEEP